MVVVVVVVVLVVSEKTVLVVVVEVVVVVVEVVAVEVVVVEVEVVVDVVEVVVLVLVLVVVHGSRKQLLVLVFSPVQIAAPFCLPKGVHLTASHVRTASINPLPHDTEHSVALQSDHSTQGLRLHSS